MSDDSRTGVRNLTGGIPYDEPESGSDRNLAALRGKSELLTDVEWDALIDENNFKERR